MIFLLDPADCSVPSFDANAVPGAWRSAAVEPDNILYIQSSRH